MSLRQEISQAQVGAMKARDENRLSILRVLWSTVRNVEIDKKRELTDEETVQVVAQIAKQLTDALKDFTVANRTDLIVKANYEISVLKEYLPEQINDDELTLVVKKIVLESGIKNASEMGKVIGLIMKEVKGRADGNRVKEIVLKTLSV